MVRAALDIASMLPATFTAPGLSEEGFLALCQQFPDALLEYTAEGTVIIMPPTDPASGARVAEIGRQLANWAARDGRGMVAGPDTGFRLPNGARRSPDASWFDAARWEAAQEAGVVFPVFAPEFVIEVQSPTDRRPVLEAKLEEYMTNGVELAWLIDPGRRTVAVYRPGRDPEMLEHPERVAGEGPVAGFELKLAGVFGSS